MSQKILKGKSQDDLVPCILCIIHLQIMDELLRYLCHRKTNRALKKLKDSKLILHQKPQ